MQGSRASLASSVVQLVDFSIGWITYGFELYKKGSLPVSDELEQATKDLVKLTEALSKPCSNGDPGQGANPPSEDTMSL